MISLFLPEGKFFIPTCWDSGKVPSGGEMIKLGYRNRINNHETLMRKILFFEKNCFSKENLLRM